MHKLFTYQSGNMLVTCTNYSRTRHVIIGLIRGPTVVIRSYFYAHFYVSTKVTKERYAVNTVGAPIEFVMSVIILLFTNRRDITNKFYIINFIFSFY